MLACGPAPIMAGAAATINGQQQGTLLPARY